jgi:predicted O-methyltransferase YrrM
MLSELQRLYDLYRQNGSFDAAYSVGQYTHRQAFDSFWNVEPVDTACYSASVERLRERRATEDSLQDILDTTGYMIAEHDVLSPDQMTSASESAPGIAYSSGAYSGYGFYKQIKLQQERESISRFANTIADHEPEVVVEIGSSLGGSFYLWNRYLDSSRFLVSVDIDFPGQRGSFFDEFDPETETRCVEGNSHTEETFERVVQALGEREVDFLYIDGDHSYEGVKQDFDRYRSLLADDGIVGLHDVTHPNNGVPAFWTELQDEYQTTEIGKTVFKNGLIEL